jgi:nucleoside-diphosphate-sugar epimerase
MNRALIIGSNSFLASYVAQLAHKKNIELIGLIHRSDNRVDYIHYKKVYFSLERLIKEEQEVDCVFFIAAFIPSGSATAQNQKYVETNIDLVSDVSKHYAKARLIFCSSISVYGYPISDFLTEVSPFNDPGLYGLSKIAGEAIVRNHPSFAIIRYSSIWGLGMTESTFLPRVINEGKKSETITLWGDGQRAQNYIHVRDAATICLTAGYHSKNICTLGVFPKSYTNLAIASTIAKKMNWGLKFEKEDKSASYTFNAEESYRELAYTPDIDILESFAELL